ncbi:MAG: hydroxymethylbilane synthase [Rhodothermales bacterium]
MGELNLTAGTRGSSLALWQTNHVISALERAWPGLSCHVKRFKTKGDKTLEVPLPQMGGKGLFTAELEHALREGDIDFAVHSLKDLPTDPSPGLTLGAVTNRTNAQDVLVAHEQWTLETLPTGATVGTSSLRRAAQLHHVRPDLDVQPIRGNVDTRVRKVHDGTYDAAVMAAAGLERLGLTDHIAEYLSLDVMLPAAGQGALAVQCRAGDTQVLALLAAIDNEADRMATRAERTFLSALGGGCSTPIAAYARVGDDAMIEMNALIVSLDGQRVIRVQGVGTDAQQLGRELAKEALGQGAQEMLAHA